MTGKFVTDADLARWRAMAEAGEWVAPEGDALHACRFEPAGFRSWRLVAPDGAWRLTVSRVDPTDADPRGVLLVEAPGHPAAFGDLDGHVLLRRIGLIGGTAVSGAARDLATRLGGEVEDWARRLDYLTARVLRAAAGVAEEAVFLDLPEPPDASPWLIDRRLRRGRTISLFGPGSAGKSTLADGLAVGLATGCEIVPEWRPVELATVGVLDWDEGKAEAAVRIGAICRGAGLRLARAIHYRAMARPLADAADEVGRWAAERGIEVLIVSPFNRALRGREHGDPGAPVLEAYAVLRELGTTNILIDHVVGAATDAADAVREYGSVEKRNAVRGSFSVFPQSTAPGARVVVIRQKKADPLSPPLDPQAVRIEYEPAWPIGGRYDAIRFRPDIIVDEGEAEPQPVRLVRLIREHGEERGGRRWLSRVELCALGGFHADGLWRIAAKARERYGLDVQGEDGGYSVEVAR
jgi:hypothetical protein